MAGMTRADTTQRSPLSDYDLDNDGINEIFVWFENQSDATPQPAQPTTTPAHPILRHQNNDIVVLPDHMHEGDTLQVIDSYDYAQTIAFDLGGSNPECFIEYPVIGGHREMPMVIATGQKTPFMNRFATGNALDEVIPTRSTINLLSVYDGRVAGVGRIVTSSTFHHYVDINLTGSSQFAARPQAVPLVGPDAVKGQGFNWRGAESTFEKIKAVFTNITDWLARPRPTIRLILQRSTFSLSEASVDPYFGNALMVIVDGLKPNNFPGGGIATLSPDASQLHAWAPNIVTAAKGLSFVPTAVSSDDPDLPDRLQRITFIYHAILDDKAFDSDMSELRLDATLETTETSAPLTDRAWIRLQRSDTPFMRSEDKENITPWLSPDMCVFGVVAGGKPILDRALNDNADRKQALAFLHELISKMTASEFGRLKELQAASAPSPFETRSEDGQRVYNFVVARVRSPASESPPQQLRVFFRTSASLTIAALQYKESSEGAPTLGFKRTTGADPIALPGTDAAGNEWLSFPIFSSMRTSPPESQGDSGNVHDLAPGTETFFGALIDNNLPDPYLPPSPLSAASPVALSTLMLGEHQSIVAQIEYDGMSGEKDANQRASGSFAQHSLALTAISDRGDDASRLALHTFEIEATPHQIAEDKPSNELLLQWRDPPPAGTEVRVHIPDWQSTAVIELADRFYPRHDIRVIDPHTVAIDAGGIRYLPIPIGLRRRTGVLSVQFPPGLNQGRRFDLIVQQIATCDRRAPLPPTKQIEISLEAANALLSEYYEKNPAMKGEAKYRAGADARGVFSLSDKMTLITDLSVLDMGGDHALLLEHPDPEEIELARREYTQWRVALGAFQIGVTVSARSEVLAHHLRLLSALRWRLQHLSRKSRWHATFARYVELNAEKVLALGGNPWSVPAAMDGHLSEIG